MIEMEGRKGRLGRFRVLSDIHADIQDPLRIEGGKDDFAVVCGDTAGDPAVSIRWIRKNLGAGVCVTGNHMPYNDRGLTMQELRDEMAAAFGPKARMTYLDAECGTVSKEWGGVLFVGSCMYSDMRISDSANPSGDATANKMRSHSCMNDYKWGVTGKRYDFGPDQPPTEVRLTPADYEKWFYSAQAAIDEALSENERREKPLPAVVVTHYPLVKAVLEHSYYVDDDNFASYGSDAEGWLLSHPSVRCHCCGHCHDIDAKWRSFKLERKGGPHVLVVNNSYGYKARSHDMTFNPNRFVNAETWELEEDPEPAAVREDKERRFSRHMALMSCFI